MEVLPSGASSLAVAAGDSGFVVLGIPGIVAFSSNGASWEAVPVETPPDNDGGIPAVGSNGLLLQAGELNGRPMVWQSSDHGRTWEATSMLLGEAFPTGQPVTMTDLIASPFGFVGVGMIGEMDEEFEEDPESASGFVIHSWDGVNWLAVPLNGAPPFTELVSTNDMIIGTFAGYGSWIWSPPGPISIP